MNDRNHFKIKHTMQLFSEFCLFPFCSVELYCAAHYNFFAWSLDRIWDITLYLTQSRKDSQRQQTKTLLLDFKISSSYAFLLFLILHLHTHKKHPQREGRQSPILKCRRGGDTEEIKTLLLCFFLMQTSKAYLVFCINSSKPV